jgi:hypothetical protein
MTLSINVEEEGGSMLMIMQLLHVIHALRMREFY